MTFMPGRPEECVNCEGTGKDPKKRRRKCPACLGNGVVEVMEEVWFDVLTDNIEPGFNTATVPVVKAPRPTIDLKED